MKFKLKKELIISSICIIILICVDQISKYLIIKNIYKLPKDIITNILKLNYCENTGVAFGMASGGVWVVTILTLIMIVAVKFFSYRYYEKTNKIMHIGSALIISGGIGNLIDRCVRGFVVDFIDISDLFNYPIFNIADIYIVIGVILIGIGYLLKERKLKNETNNSKK